MSAQICSLSLNVVEDWREMIFGFVQALLSPLAAAARSSVLETPIPSNPRKLSTPPPLVFAVRFA